MASLANQYSRALLQAKIAMTTTPFTLTPSPADPQPVTAGECYACKGVGEVTAHLNYGGSDGEWKIINCPTFVGTCEISGEHAARIEAGRKARHARIIDGISLSEQARRLGITPAQLSAMEHGREL